jgi:beta-D-galactosyl-(1->4)-L-rhamnose phosphorylase
MANVLGVDKDTGARINHGKWAFEPAEAPFTMAADVLAADPHLYLTDGKATVLHAADGVPQMTLNRFGKGFGVYMSQFRVTAESTRMLLELLLHVNGVKPESLYLSDTAEVETAYFPQDNVLVLTNRAEETVECTVHTPEGDQKWQLASLETKIIAR